MPPLNAHLRFASLLIARGKVGANLDAFLLGCVAPDVFIPGKRPSFSRHHFSEESGGINLKAFQASNRLERLSTQSQEASFLFGYYAHLWLDVYFSERAQDMPITRPSLLSDAEVRQAIRREAEAYDAPFIAGLRTHLLADFASFAPPPEFEFIVLERCAQAMKRLAEQAPTALSPAVLDKGGYEAFMETSVETFLRAHLFEE